MMAYISHEKRIGDLLKALGGSYFVIFILFFLSGCGSGSGGFTRGIGVYPGDPSQDFSPVVFRDSAVYRNLAFHRPGYHSSSYDYNLTAQLVTDGIIDTRMPYRISCSTSQDGILTKNEREW